MRSGPAARTRDIVLWSSSLPALLAASWLYYPFAFEGPVLCPFRLMTGVPCPGCGLTRAFCLMAHGHFAEATHYHALAPVVLAYLLFLWGYKLIEVVRGRPPQLPTYTISACALVTMAVFWVARLTWFFGRGDGVAVVLHDNAIARLIRVFT